MLDVTSDSSYGDRQIEHSELWSNAESYPWVPINSNSKDIVSWKQSCKPGHSDETDKCMLVTCCIGTNEQ